MTAFVRSARIFGSRVRVFACSRVRVFACSCVRVFTCLVDVRSFVFFPVHVPDQFKVSLGLVYG